MRRDDKALVTLPRAQVEKLSQMTNKASLQDTGDAILKPNTASVNDADLVTDIYTHVITYGQDGL